MVSPKTCYEDDELVVIIKRSNEESFDFVDEMIAELILNEQNRIIDKNYSILYSINFMLL